MFVARLVLFLCILVSVAAICHHNGESCTTHSECCSAMCLTNVGQCAPKNGALWA